MIILTEKEVDLCSIAELMLNGDMVGIGDNKGNLKAMIFVKKEDE